MEKFFDFMYKVLKIFIVLVFAAIWIFSFWLWWYCFKDSESSIFEAAVSLIILVIINIFVDVFAYATWDLVDRATKTIDKVIDKLLDD